MVNIIKLMPLLLKNISQSGMDLFYKDYKSDFQFFTLDDFIDNTGNTIAGIYQKYYEAQYKELKGEKKDEVVTFDTGMLSEQILDVKRKDELLYAEITQPIMTFMYDQNATGIQIVQDLNNGEELDRTTLTELWQLKYLPKTNRIFFYSDVNKINFVNKGSCNLTKVRVLFVPQMYPDAIIADTVADDAVQQTVLQMRQLMDDQVVKKTLDNNPNMIPQTELNKGALI